jgi:hypothetical protein
MHADGNAVADQAAQYLPHGVFVALIQVQVTVFLIAFQDFLALQTPGNPVADRMHKLRQFLLIRGAGAEKTTYTHWHMSCSGNTSSTNSTARSPIQRAPQLGQNQRRLQLNATSGALAQE